MSTTSKSDFFSRPKIKALPPPEREKRWKQHLMSEGGLKAVKTKIIGDDLIVGNQWYLRTLVDPEQHKSYGVPDLASTPSYKYQSILERDVKLVQKADGKYHFSVVAYPDVDSALLEVAATQSAANKEYRVISYVDTGSALQASQVINGETRFLTGSVPKPYSASAPYRLLGPDSSGFSIYGKGAWISRSGNDFNAKMPIHGTGGYGGFWGWPVNQEDKFRLSLSGRTTAVASGIKLEAHWCNQSGTFLGVSDVFLTSTSSYTSSITTPAFSAWNTPYASAAYLTALYISFATLVDGGNDGIALELITGNHSPSVNDGYGELDGVPVTDLSDVIKNFSAIRPVSGSLLITYQGDVTKGGQIASRLYPSVERPYSDNTPSLTYSDIAQRPGSYSGSVRHGTYVFWAPQSEHDMLYRPLETPGSSTDDSPLGAAIVHEGFSFMAAAGSLSSEEVMRVRVIWNWELLTTTQLFGTTPSPVDPQLIWDASRHLSGFPTAFPNDSHLEVIGRFLKKGGKWAWRNKEKIQQLLTSPDLASLGANILSLA